MRKKKGSISSIKKPKKHPRFKEIVWALGYVDSNGAVHGKFIFFGDPNGCGTHAHHFPNCNHYKTWRWCKSEGFMLTRAKVDLDTDDWEMVHSWMFKRGCYNDWELD